MPLIEERYSHLYIHRKSKSLINVETELDKESKTVVHSIYKNNNGVTGELLSDGIFTKSAMPKTNQ